MLHFIWGCRCYSVRLSNEYSCMCVVGARVEAKAPVFSSTLKDCSVSEGQDFILQCSVEGRPLPEISWMHNGKTYCLSETSNYHRFSNSHFRVTWVKASAEWIHVNVSSPKYHIQPELNKSTNEIKWSILQERPGQGSSHALSQLKYSQLYIYDTHYKNRQQNWIRISVYIWSVKW